MSDATAPNRKTDHVDNKCKGQACYKGLDSVALQGGSDARDTCPRNSKHTLHAICTEALTRTLDLQPKVKSPLRRQYIIPNGKDLSRKCVAHL